MNRYEWLQLVTLSSVPLMLLSGLLVGMALLIGPRLPASDNLLYISQPRIDNRASLYIHDLRHAVRHALRNDLIGWGLDAAWSPDGRSIVYSTFQPNEVRRDLYIIDLSQNQPRRITREDLLDHNSPSWSPDGCCLVYQAVSSGTDWDVFIHDLHSDERQLLFASDGIDGMPVWSPDGTQIAFITPVEGSGAYYAVHLLELASDTLEVLELPLPLPDSGHYIMLDWSPDGQSLVVAASDQVSSYRIYRLETTDGSVTLIQMPLSRYTSAIEPAWSPDGTRIAFTRSPRDGSLHIYTFDLNSGSLRQITWGREGYRQPAWRPSPG